MTYATRVDWKMDLLREISLTFSLLWGDAKHDFYE